MSFNGSGTFVINSSGNPVVTGTTISSTWANALTADLATGLSTCVTKDGQTTTTAIVPFAAGINVTATASSFYIVSTATFTLTGCTTAPTYVGKYTIIGNTVVLSWPGNAVFINATSNATSKTLTGLPSALWPSGPINVATTSVDNGGTATFGFMRVESTGVITLITGANPTSTTSWTNSGSMNIAPVQLTWTIA